MRFAGDPSKCPTPGFLIKFTVTNACPQVLLVHQSIHNLNMEAKLREALSAEAERVKTITEEAVKSGAYIYPLKVRKGGGMLHRSRKGC
jgi:hypothetical protein